MLSKIPYPEDDCLTLLKTLATTPGPSLNEEPRRKIIEKFLADNGIPFSVDKAGNLWATFGQGRWEDSIVYDAHMDVVQDGYVHELKRENGNLVGMGVADNLTAVTMLSLLCRVLKSYESGLTRPVAVLFSTGEEGDGNLKGVRQVVRDHPTPPFLFISFDLSFNEYSVTGLGSRRYRVTFSCPGGHSWGDYGMPAAIDQMIAFLSELKQSYLVKEGHNTGGVSFNTGTVNGGEGINSISRHAETTFEFRSVSSDVLDELHNVVERLVSSINTRDDVDAVCEITGERPAGSSVMPERIEPVIISLLNDIGEPSESVPRSTNINVPLHEGWPSVCIGICRGGRYHSADEYVELESLPKGWEFLLKMTEHFMM